MLPVIGLGSSKVVEQVAQNGTEPLANVLRALVAHGGKLVDTWPRNAANDAGLGRVLALPEFRDTLFVTTKVDQVGKDAGIKQFRDAQRNYQREVIDLAQIFSLTDLDTHWPSLKDWKARAPHGTSASRCRRIRGMPTSSSSCAASGRTSCR